MIWKIPPLLKFQIIVVFVKTLIADYKYPLPEFAVPYSNATILKTETLFSVVCSIYEIYIKF